MAIVRFQSSDQAEPPDLAALTGAEGDTDSNVDAPPPPPKPGHVASADPGLLRHLPSVDKLKAHAHLAELPAAVRSHVARAATAEARAAVLAGQVRTQAALEQQLDAAVARALAVATGPLLRRIHNGSGVLLHTNAGRAPLPPEAVAALTETAGGYCNLEFSLHSGRRSSRQDHVRTLLQWLTGAEAALVVNNGAAALLLALHALAHGREGVVSRGELVEIGGGFRIPEVMAAAGATLREVGTTNRTHLHDYRGALNPASALVLQVHRSNFALVGFTATPALAELATLAHDAGLPLVVDLGSGALEAVAGVETEVAGHGRTREPTVTEVLAAGADLVTFSGDKLLGGPQAGILVGRADLMHRLAASPMARALRVDNLVLTALEQVLRLHLHGRGEHLPVPAALALPEAEVDQIASTLATVLARILGPHWQVEVVAGETRLGGGTDPLVAAPSRCLSVGHPACSGAHLARSALTAPVPLLGRARGERLLLDVRSLLAGAGPRDLETLAGEWAQALRCAQPRADR